MPKVLLFLLALLAPSPGLTQMLLADRTPSGAARLLGLPKGTSGFLADDFQAGTKREVWVIDHIRLWTGLDPRVISGDSVGDLFRSLTLYGGIAPALPAPDQDQGPDCDCHNLPALRTAVLKSGSNATDTSGATITDRVQADGSRFWQIDFEDLEWSVPGATPIQFGVLAEKRSDSSYDWYYAASSGDRDHLRVFSSIGKLKSVYQEGGPTRIDIKVWGHLLVSISIRRIRQKLQVVLRGSSSLDPSQVDTASLRFGPGNSVPGNVRVEVAEHDGERDIVMDFKLADLGLPPNAINACLTGQRLDSAPFQGCDLLPH
jgi:hypothetical protein